MDYRYDGINGTFDGEYVYCPARDHSCPYYKKGLCCMEDGDPMEECDEMGVYENGWDSWIDENEEG